MSTKFEKKYELKKLRHLKNPEKLEKSKKVNFFITSKIRENVERTCQSGKLRTRRIENSATL